MSNAAEAYGPFREALDAYDSIYPEQTVRSADYDESHELLWVSGYVQHWMGQNALRHMIEDSGYESNPAEVFDPSVLRDTAILYANNVVEQRADFPVSIDSINVARTLGAIQIARKLWSMHAPQYDQSKLATMYGLGETVGVLLDSHGSCLREVDVAVARDAVRLGEAARKQAFRQMAGTTGAFEQLLEDTKEVNNG